MDTAALDKLAGSMERPDDAARVAAQNLLRQRRPGSLGRLGTAAAWLAAVTGQCPPPAPRRTRLIVLGDSDAAPPATALLADIASRGVHAARADAGTDDPAEALARGVALAEAEADAGTDLLLLAAPSTLARIPAATLIAAFTRSDSHSLIRSTGDDAEWMRAVGAVRDGLRRLKRANGDPLATLDAAGGTEIAHLTGVLIGAAARRTPVVIDGFACVAAALVTHRISDRTTGWVLAAHSDGEPATAAALRHLGLVPLLDLGLEPGDGVAAAVAAQMLQVAAAMLAGA